MRPIPHFLIFRRRLRWWGLAMTVAVVGCGGGNTNFQDLGQPVIWWEHASGLCTALIAIDRHQVVWDDRGCEEPVDFERVGSVSAQVRADLETRIAGLAEFPAPTRADCSGNLHTLGAETDVTATVRTACGTGTDLGDAAGLPQPFLGVVRAFAAAAAP